MDIIEKLEVTRDETLSHFQSHNEHHLEQIRVALAQPPKKRLKLSSAAK